MFFIKYPKINFGTYRLGDKTFKSLEYAFSNGYTSIDTASLYKNEEFIGNFLGKYQVPRNDIWITSKLNPKVIIDTPHEIIKSITKTLTDLNTPYLDLYLIHCPKEEHIIKCWDILEQFQKKGIFRNIGVSNFDIPHMETIKQFSSSLNPIFTNQIELSPFLKRSNIVKYLAENNIKISAHSSLTKGEKFNDPTIIKISQKYSKSPAQILLKWALQNNFYIIPRSSNLEHIIEDISLDFEIDEKDMNELNDIQITHITHPQYKYAF